MSTAASRLDKLQKLLQLDPDDAFVLYGLAQEYAKTGPDGQAQAIGFYDRCIASDPKYCYAYYHKAVTLQALSRRDDAKAAAVAGLDSAKAAGDAKAISELTNLLNTL